MRYALRNQQKIESVYPGTNKRILNSLTAHFEAMNEIVPIESGEQYPIIIIEDTSKNNGMISFYIISILWDVYTLAFKEFIK